MEAENKTVSKKSTKRGTKTESSRLNIFYILYVLEQYTDAEHPLSASKISELVNQEFGYLSTDGKLLSMDTVKRTLEELIGKVFSNSLNIEEYMQRYGYVVYEVMKTSDGYKKYCESDEKPQPTRYYYYESNLTVTEIQIMKDALETHYYFSEEDVTGMVNKLMRLRPSFFRKSYTDMARETRDEDSLLLLNIEDLHRIISNRNAAEITYCSYNEDKELEVRPGYPKVLEPVHLMWSNGYYYLLAYNEKYKNIINMRVDRITDIKEIESEENHGLEHFNPVQYRHEHPVMYGGEKQKVTLLCRDTGKNHIMNLIVDLFGKNVRVTQASEELIEKQLGHSKQYYEEQGITWLKITMDTVPAGVELWATQYCNDCRIVSPEESAQRVKDRLTKGLEYYK